MEARGYGGAAPVRGAASAAAGLADVVRRPGQLSEQPLVPGIYGTVAGRLPRGRGPLGGEPVPIGAAAVRAGPSVRVSVHGPRRAPRGGRLVDAGAEGGVLPGGVFKAG